MKNLLLVRLAILMGLTFSMSAFANEGQPYFEGPNFSGIYSCKGSNNKVGEYEILATLKLNRANSHGNFGVYDFTTETENDVVYKGQAIANGYKMALTFNLSNARGVEFSTGIADVTRISSKRQVVRRFIAAEAAGHAESPELVRCRRNLTKNLDRGAGYSMAADLGNNSPGHFPWLGGSNCDNYFV